MAEKSSVVNLEGHTYIRTYIHTCLSTYARRYTRVYINMEMRIDSLYIYMFNLHVYKHIRVQSIIWPK